MSEENNEVKKENDALISISQEFFEQSNRTQLITIAQGLIAFANIILKTQDALPQQEETQEVSEESE